MSAPRYIHINLTGNTGNIVINDSEFWNYRKVQQSTTIKLIRSIAITNNPATPLYNVYISALGPHTVSNIVNQSILIPVGTNECAQEFECFPYSLRSTLFNVYSPLGALTTDTTVIDLLFEVV
jgi:hypothetical protein